MKSNWLPLFFLSAVVASPVLFAADGTWTNNNSGNWSTAGNWRSGIVADGAGSTAYFTNDINLNRTVSSDVIRSIGNLEFSDSGGLGFSWILGGGSTLTLSGAATSEVRWLTPVEIIAPLAGSADMLFTGPTAGFGSISVLALKGTNTFTGLPVLRRGGLTAWGNSPSGGNGAMGNSTNAIQVGDSGTLGTDNLQFLMNGDKADFGRPLVVNNVGNIVTIGNLADGGHTMVWSGDITLNKSVLLAGHAGVMRIPGRITGTGGITKTDVPGNNATIVLQGSNDFSGDITVSRGTLLAGASNALGTATTAISLGDTNTAADAVWLRITNGVTLSRDILVTTNGTGVAGIGLNYNSTTGSYAGKITLDRTLTIESKTSGRLNLYSPITGSGGLIVGGNVDGNTYFLCPTNTYTGETYFKYGIFNVTNVVKKAQFGPLGFSTNAILMGNTSADNPSFYIDANGTVDRDFRVQWAVSAKIATRTATNLVISGNLSIVSNGVTIITPESTTTLINWTGDISSMGVVQQGGSGVLVLSGNNSAISGGINLSAGTLRLNSASPIGSGRFRFASYDTRLENSYGPYTFTNAVEFGRPAYYYGPYDVVFLGDKKINANLSTLTLTVDQTNALLGFRGNLTSLDITCGLTKVGAGIAEWGGTNLTALFTNLVTINAGVLRTYDGTSISTQSTIRLFGGVWESTGTCTRTLGQGVGQGQLYWGGNGGFSAYGAPFTMDLYGAASNLHLWGSNNFVSAQLQFGSVRADNPVVFTDRIDLNGASRTIVVYDNTNSIADKAVLDGGLQGSTAHGITKLGPGVLVLGATNTYLADTAVNEGTLLVDGELAYSATAVVQNKTNTWLGGRGTIKRRVTLDPGFGGFDWADAPGTLTIQTNLTLPRAFTYNFRRVAITQVPLVNVTGTLTASNAVTVNVFGDTRTPLVLFTAGALAGTQNLTNWVVTGSSKDYTVKVQGLSIVATCPSAGTIISVR